ncbi:MAG: glycosyltransferase family 39 protein, partial [Verrucomicrobia bacterium]|nr:glycosyltransferase family 39 protein [Verrucomicrobiota bacterium]
MKAGFKLRIIDWVVPLGFGLALWLVAPLSTGLQFGGDEGYELMKALLVSRGHALYGPFWNDQPPLHTELVALLFRVFGPSALAGRLVSVGFAMLLVVALYGLASERSGRVAGLVAVGLLVAAPDFLVLSVSVMLEMPAMAMGLAAAWAWSKYDRGGGWRRLMASGVLFGCALQVKLTAMILGPALVVDWVARQLLSRRGQGSATGRRGLAAVSEGLVWAGAVVVAFGLIGLAFYRQDTVEVFWRSHFSTGTRAATVADSYEFRVGAMVNEFALVVPAAAGGIILIGWQRRRDLLFPVVMLGTVLAVHWVERPYWPYYGLHFAVPLAWLGGVGVVEGFRLLWRQELGTTIWR